MENSESLSQVLAAMQEQTELLAHMVDSKIQESEARIKVMIENDIVKRLDALTDGYKLNYEKQYELEKRLEDLERHVERLEVSAGLAN